jgi:hypothetical protein
MKVLFTTPCQFIESNTPYCSYESVIQINWTLHEDALTDPQDPKKKEKVNIFHYRWEMIKKNEIQLKLISFDLIEEPLWCNLEVRVKGNLELALYMAE